MNMATCDECNGWLNPALAVDAAVKRGDSILLIQRKYPPCKAVGGCQADLLSEMKTH